MGIVNAWEIKHDSFSTSQLVISLDHEQQQQQQQQQQTTTTKVTISNAW